MALPNIALPDIAVHQTINTGSRLHNSTRGRGELTCRTTLSSTRTPTCGRMTWPRWTKTLINSKWSTSSSSREKEERSIRHCHRRQQLHWAHLYQRQHQPQLLLRPLNEWSSWHHVLRIWHWMPIMMMVWRLGTGGLKTYWEEVNHRDWWRMSSKKRWPNCILLNKSYGFLRFVSCFLLLKNPN